MSERAASSPTMGRIAHLVDHVGTRDFCAALSAAVGAFLDFDNLIVLAYAGAATPHDLHREFVSPVCFAQMNETYLASHYVLDPFYAAHLNHVRRGLYRLEDVAPDKFRSTSYFLEYYRKTTLVDEVALFAYTATGWTVTACFGRDHISGKRFERRQLTELSKVADILVALMERHWAGFAPESEAEAPEDGSAEMVEALAAALRTERGIVLTARQLQVGLLILQGHSTRSIALKLGISWQTVKVFRKQLYARCAISSQAELFALLLPLIGRREAAGFMAAS